MIGCYHLVKMKVGEEIWAWGYTFKFQAENSESEEMTKKEQEKNKTKPREHVAGARERIVKILMMLVK